MERGQLSEMQRNIAWEGKSQSEREATTAFNLNLGGEDNARTAGIRVTAAGQAREAEYQERKRNEDRFRDAIQRIQLSERAQAVYDALGDYGDRLRDEQRRIERRMAELRERGEARDTISELIATGALDRDNAEHLALIDRAGLDPDHNDDELRNTIDRDAAQAGEEYDALAARHAEIERQLPLVEAARERIENGEDPDAVLSDLANEGIHIEVDPTDELQVRREIVSRGQDLDAERQDRQPAMEAADSAVTEDQPSLDDEVETFMRALANNQQMMLEGSALHDAMRGQIDGLSDEAREQLEATEETAFLFEQNEVQPAVPAQDPTAPIEDHRPDQSPGITPGSNL